MNALIIDDSELDRLNLKTLLDDHPQIKVIGEADTLARATSLIIQKVPDLIFLDVHLGKEKGFKALSGIDAKPQVIFTTAHSEYALKGFELNAVDYIVKPVDEGNLARALARLQPTSRREFVRKRLDLNSSVTLRKNTDLNVHQVSEIVHISSSKPLTCVTVNSGCTYLHRNTLRDWTELLPRPEFLQLDRSTVINTSHIKRISLSEEKPRLHFASDLQPLVLGRAAEKTLREFLAL